MNEIRDLIIAFIVLSIAFAISSVGVNIHGIISILPIVMVGVGAGFVLFAIAGIMTLVSMVIGAENIVKLFI